MNHYELLAIVSGRYADTEIESAFEKVEELLKKTSAQLHYRQNLDRKRLAYPIKGQVYGYYFLVEFDAEASQLKKIDRELGLSQDILRHSILRKKTVGKPKIFDSRSSLEQEAFGKGAPKGVFGSVADIVGGLAEESSLAPAASTPSAPVQTPEVQPSPVIEPIVAVTPTEELQPAVAVSAPREETTQEEEAAGETEKLSAKKKKDQKVSYEELDKKLDEILKNDML